MNALHGHDIEDLRVGMSARFAKTITEADIVLFAGVSGDNNAIHTNEEFAASTPFKGRIAHGMLSASVKELVPERHRALLTTCCFVAYKLAIEGEALVMTTARALN